MMVYVVTVQHTISGGVRTLPQVFKSIDKAKDMVKETWGLNVGRVTPSTWKGLHDDFVVSIDKRTVF